MLKTHVLVLNQNYEPMSITDAKKAIVLLYLEKAELVEKYDSKLVKSVSVSFPLPSIVRLTRFICVPRKRIVLSRKNIIKRDGHRCQYCGTTAGPITVDHIIPKGRGGQDVWENLVCACTSCNNRKGDRTPEEVGMKLLTKPVKPNHIFFLRYHTANFDKRWKPYLFMN